MPLYDYRCGACGREVEVMHGIHDRGPATCEACGGTMSKVLSPPAIHFKGSGWAKKDAASASKAKPRDTSAAAEAGTGEVSGSAEGKGTGSGKGSDSGKPATPATTSAGATGKGKD